MAKNSIKPKRITTFSLFCGLGGEHLGKQLAFKDVGMFDRCTFWALNHWQVAIDTLQRNFPHALTYCEDITRMDVSEIGLERIDLLWASPSCTHHSNARGGKPREDQQRAHATEVYFRWLDRCDIPVFLMENVREFLSWGPLDEYGKPVKSRKGEFFREWVRQLQNAGYEVEWKILCAADYGDPTTRKRLFLQAVKDGKGIHWPKPTHRCVSHGQTAPGCAVAHGMTVEEYEKLPPWKSAAEHVIDWTIPGKSIYYRKKPLAPDTIRRIKHGLKTYGLAPYFAAYHGGPDASRRLSLLWQPLPTLDCSNRFALIRSFISKGFGGNYRGPGESIFSPLPTITTKDHNFLVRPALCVMRGRSNSVDVVDPLSTVSCGFHHQLMRSCLVQHYGWQTDRGTGGLSLDAPFPTVCSAGHHSLVRPIIVRADFTKAAPQIRTIDFPISSVVTKACHHFIEAFVIETDYRHQVHKGKQSIFDPLATITTTPRHALVDPFIVEYYGTSLSQSLWVPLPTVTTKDRHGLVDLVIQHEGSVESLPVVRAPEDIDAHDFARPFCIEIDGARYLVDITLRMLAPRELARAMGFPESFRFEKLDGTPLTKQDAVKMIGNACPVNTVRELVKAVIKPRAAEFGGER